MLARLSPLLELPHVPGHLLRWCGKGSFNALSSEQTKMRSILSGAR